MNRNEVVSYIIKRIGMVTKNLENTFQKQANTKKELTPEEKLLIAIFGENGYKANYKEFKKSLLIQTVVNDMFGYIEAVLSGYHDDEIPALKTEEDVAKWLEEDEVPSVLIETETTILDEYKALCDSLDYFDEQLLNRMLRIEKQIKLNAPPLIIKNEKRLLSEVCYQRDKIVSLKTFIERFHFQDVENYNKLVRSNIKD